MLAVNMIFTSELPLTRRKHYRSSNYLTLTGSGRTSARPSCVAGAIPASAASALYRGHPLTYRSRAVDPDQVFTR